MIPLRPIARSGVPLENFRPTEHSLRVSGGSQTASSELSNAVWNFATGPWRFDRPIWTGRHIRPLPFSHYSWLAEHTWPLIFLADATERLAAAFHADPETNLKQAAVDLAVRASRGELGTWTREEVAGAVAELPPRTWAAWMPNDELLDVFATCTVYVDFGVRAFIFVDADDLERCISAIRLPPVEPPQTPPPATGRPAIALATAKRWLADNPAKADNYSIARAAAAAGVSERTMKRARAR